MTPDTRVPAAAESYPTFWDDALRVPTSSAPIPAGGRAPADADDSPDDDATDEHAPLDRR